MSNIKFAREIEFSWLIKATDVETILKRPDVRWIQTIDIEQRDIGPKSSMSTLFDFKGRKHEHHMTVQLRSRIRKETVIMPVSEKAALDGQNKIACEISRDRYSHTTKYQLFYDEWHENSKPADRLELETLIDKSEYDWLVKTEPAGEVTQKKRVIIMATLHNGIDRLFSIDIYRDENLARIELEVTEDEASANKQDVTPEWLDKIQIATADNGQRDGK